MKNFILSLSLSFICFLSFGQNSDIERLKQELLGTTEDTIRVLLLDSLSLSYTWSSADTAWMYASQELELAKKLNYKKGEAYGLISLGQAETTLGNYNNALSYIYQSIPLCVELGDSLGLFSAYNGLFFCYRELGDFEKSKSWAYQCLRWVERSPTKNWTVTDVLDFMSSIFERNNQLDSALYCANTAYPDHQSHSGLLYELGAIHSKLGHDSIALDFYRRAIPLAVANNSQIDVIDSYNGISQIYLKEGKADSAIFYGKLALKQKWGKTYPIGIFRASELLAKIYESQKKTDSTLKYLKQTIALKDSLFNQQKTREASAFAFNEQLHQQELKQQLEQNDLKYRSRFKIYFLLGSLLALAVVAVGLWRRNIYKQKSFALLQKQKQETDNQKSKVEKTLEELKITQAQLIQSEKMASLGEMTAGIAHEIQNPLNFINNFSEVNTELIKEMKNEIDKGNFNEARSITDNIIQNEEKIIHHGKRADSIVKGMLQHSRTSTGQKEPTDINALADEYLRLSYHGLRAKDGSFNATMKTDFDPSIGKINIVPQYMGRVLLNMFNNAFYAVLEKKKSTPQPPEGGVSYEPCVTVITKAVKNPSGGLGVLISIQDNGNGIPQKIIDKIFQPFFTTKPTGQGTGLGLSLSYDIIKAHGGEIKVETKEGERSEFIIHLPFQ